MLFDDDRNPIGLEEELKIISDSVKHIQQDIPHFRLKLIITGLKIVGRPHVTKMIGNIIDGRYHSDLIAGFDMVNEEDFTPPILEFINEILDGKKKDHHKLPCFFHCGETHDRENENLFDAVLLETKRIGHGFQLFLHPHLQDQVKKKDICIEACPISNLLLGYVTDLRSHPVRYMLHKGL
jgi:adenosine deaminase CECR1